MSSQFRNKRTLSSTSSLQIAAEFVGSIQNLDVVGLTGGYRHQLEAGRFSLVQESRGALSYRPTDVRTVRHSPHTT